MRTTRIALITAAVAALVLAVAVAVAAQSDDDTARSIPSTKACFSSQASLPTGAIPIFPDHPAQ